MQLMDSLSLYKMQDYDTLFHVSTSQNFHGTDYKDDYYGWISKRNQASILLIDINGKEHEIEKKTISGFTALPLSKTTIDTLIARHQQDLEFYKCNFASNYPLVLWLYKKGQLNYSRQLLREKAELLCDSCLRDDFGIIYYDAMLSAFSNQRDYPKAIAFGEHLSGKVFNGYEYQKVVIALTGQLKDEPQDFKTFRLPDSLEWSALKKKLNRNDQIIYLADRLRLLNCIQPGQPGGIDYSMYQYSISFAEANKIGISYWDNNSKYYLVNPYSELLRMKLNLRELEALLPYLLTDTYIPSYNYHRDFFRERNLHKLSWVIHEMIFEITNKHFFDHASFDSLTFGQKNVEIEKIKQWCDENASIGKKELIINILKTTDQWIDFRKALETAKQEKYDSLLSAIVGRFNDFKDLYSPVHKWAIAETMFELGTKNTSAQLKAGTGTLPIYG